ncbi:MAG TPA: HIT family protein [Pseudonocardiaceae bacterium]|nr:HIT family protein [Pseudonocardiaceae bacterium]
MSHPRNEQGCPFDPPRIQAAEYADDGEFAALYNVAPVLPGHSLVVPRRHVGRLGALTDDEVCRLFMFARRITEFLLSRFNADGFDWTIQDGTSAGQTVDHVHLHVIPRQPRDLPSPGDWHTRVIDSHLRQPLSDAELNVIVTSLRHSYFTITTT